MNKTAEFLSAKWLDLIMINYEIDPSVLAPFVPQGTEVDLWNGKAYISIVGFMFLDTYVKGIPIPFHRNFEEVNLRFYVKRTNLPEGDRRGVVFISEVVPRWAIAFLARLLYNEKYVSLPMRHSISDTTLQYQWKYQDKWQQIKVTRQGEPQPLEKGSLAEFILEHYWGYNKQRNGSTMEYQVDHPSWRIWEVKDYEVDVDMRTVYGLPFSAFLEKPPASVFLAEGSDVKVYKGRRL